MSENAVDVRKVELRVSNEKAYVWDVDDLAVLRAQHHICGVLTGTLPHLSQQNVFLGVPLVLLPEEVVLLVEKQLAVLIDDPTAHRPPSTAQLEKWNNARRAGVHGQLAAAQTKEAPKVLSEDALRKRREREEKRARVRATAASANPDSVSADLLSPSLPSLAPMMPVPTQTIEQAAADRPATLNVGADTNSTSALPPSAVYTVTVPASSPAALPWYSPDAACTYTTIEAARAAGVWTYPRTPFERAKCAVYRDLWGKGHFMGGGIKFGGDFLVYPGDPLRYHSHFVATVIESSTIAIRPMEIVAHGRLGTATKKSHLICGYDEETKEVSYYSIEWASFG